MKRTATAVAAALLVLLGACGGGDDADVAPTPASSPQTQYGQQLQRSEDTVEQLDQRERQVEEGYDSP